MSSVSSSPESTVTSLASVLSADSAFCDDDFVKVQLDDPVPGKQENSKNLDNNMEPGAVQSDEEWPRRQVRISY
jgi:hypothetical protein